MHHNYISGDELKFRRALAFGAIVQANDTMPSFLRRARVSMECVPQWTTGNTLGGQQLKFWRATVFGAVVQTNDTMQSFLRSARAAMRKLPSWIPPGCHSAIRALSSVSAKHMGPKTQLASPRMTAGVASSRGLSQISASAKHLG